jgi:hypothetical protein
VLKSLPVRQDAGHERWEGSVDQGGELVE